MEPTKNPTNHEARLQKLIASAGFCSRRAAEKLITDGRVSVNGKVVTELGTKATSKDKIAIDGKPLSKPAATLTIMMNKPRGILTTKSDPFGGKTVMDLLPKNLRHLNPIGRLDKDSEGLLLLTSDGELLNRLTHPRYGHSKIYEVLVHGTVSEATLKNLNQKRLFLDGYYLQPMQVALIKTPASSSSTDPQKGTFLRFTLKEGRKRQIRRVMEFYAHPVILLKRIAIGELTLGDLKSGTTKILTEKELTMLS
ncbi:MAG: pseudouridine synthase [Candidatus Gracilibacteria bacterium]|jgi:pseudouridine synthase